ncbi:hypothetical protein ACFXGT_08365 [Streptomyces sp. NPDC059352]|uniref:hypothetical protein n=1 Tax=Streptomyces sp. NPDC059352 TaxID=3346810 RepID=UPI00369DDBF7
MNGVTTPQAGVRVELTELPRGMALAAREQDGQLLMLLNPEATPERLRDDLASILGHLFDHGLITWSNPQEPGLP